MSVLFSLSLQARGPAQEFQFVFTVMLITMEQIAIPTVLDGMTVAAITSVMKQQAIKSA